MFAYSYPKGHKLHKDVIPKLVGCTAVVFDKTYKVIKSITKESLENIHKDGAAYLISDKLYKNMDDTFEGAVTPAYYVFPETGSILISNKKLYNVGAYTKEKDDVYYSQGLYVDPPQKKKILQLFKDKKKDSESSNYAYSEAIQDLGTAFYSEPYCSWTSDGWVYTYSGMPFKPWQYERVKVGRDGLLTVNIDGLIKGLPPASIIYDMNTINKEIMSIIDNDKADAQQTPGLEHNYRARQRVIDCIRASYLVLNILEQIIKAKKTVDIEKILDIVLTISKGKADSDLYLQAEMILDILDADGLL